MKNLFLCAAALLLLSSGAIARSHRSHHSRSDYGNFSYSGSGLESRSVEHVHGYHRRNGTYVHSYDRTTPDDTQRDNWSARGNRNLETGKFGDKRVTH